MESKLREPVICQFAQENVVCSTTQRQMGGLTVTVMVPVGVVPAGEVMVPLTVTGALAAGLPGVTVCVTDVGLVPPPPPPPLPPPPPPPPPTTVRSVARLAVGAVAPVAAQTSSCDRHTQAAAYQQQYITAASMFTRARESNTLTAHRLHKDAVSVLARRPDMHVMVLQQACQAPHL